jgi:hypothetical protein
MRKSIHLPDSTAQLPFCEDISHFLPKAGERESILSYIYADGRAVTAVLADECFYLWKMESVPAE